MQHPPTALYHFEDENPPDFVMTGSRYFLLQELASPDTGEIAVHPRLLYFLDHARDQLRRPIIVTSGYRTEAHNRAVGGAPDSQHLYGRAADIVPHDPNHFRHLGQILLRLQPPGLGLYCNPRGRRWFHIDVRPGTVARWGTVDERKADREGFSNALRLLST